jgi:adenylate cyclase, class 2
MFRTLRSCECFHPRNPRNPRLNPFQNVRIHLDEVEGLGAFLEFEAVMPDGIPDSSGQSQLHKLMRDFSINEEDLIEDSYCNMLERKSNGL